MDSLLSQPVVAYAVGALVLFLLYSKLLPLFRVPGGKDAVMGRLLGSSYAESKMQREIAMHRKQGNHLLAGKLLEDAGRLQEASEAYLEGHETFAAASLLERLGKHERAAELFLQAGEHKKAAEVFTAAGKPAKAALLFLEKGNTLEAARLFALAGQWDKTAELYDKGGYPQRAAEAYEKQGELLKAAEAYERHFLENVSYGTAYAATAVSTDQKSALAAGRLFVRAGELGRAQDAFLKGSYFKEAAEVAAQRGQFAKAAEMFLRAEDPQRAADAYDKAGDVVRAANLRGEVALKADRVPEAAGHFVRGQDYLRAAELYESVGLLEDAAKAYEAGESWAAAGSVYVRAGLPGRAAQSYERAGDHETAARLYEDAGETTKSVEEYARAGFTFKSGQAAARAGDHVNAIALLQKVAPNDENYAPATRLLADLFVSTGHPELAIERVQRVLGDTPLGPSNLSLHLGLAAAREARGELREAMDLYQKIQAEDMRYEDVGVRVSRLAARLAASPTSGDRRASPPPASAERRGAAAAAPAPPAAKPAAPAPPAAAAAPGAPLFTIHEELGRGPLGVVHRAAERSGRSVALRFLDASVPADKELLASLAADIKAAGAFTDRHVAKVLGLARVDGRTAVVGELVQGKSLAEPLATGARMNVSQVHGLGRVLAQALASLHAAGLVHGSLQPSNVVVSAGTVKITDLGLGRLAQRRAIAESYRAPGLGLDVPGDLYDLATLLYHLLTGVHPRTLSQGVALPLPSTYTPATPEALDKLLVRCLHPRPEMRLPSAEAVLAELKDMVKIG